MWAPSPHLEHGQNERDDFRGARDKSNTVSILGEEVKVVGNYR